MNEKNNLSGVPTSKWQVVEPEQESNQNEIELLIKEDNRPSILFKISIFLKIFIINFYNYLLIALNTIAIPSVVLTSIYFYGIDSTSIDRLNLAIVFINIGILLFLAGIVLLACKGSSKVTKVPWNTYLLIITIPSVLILQSIVINNNVISNATILSICFLFVNMVLSGVSILNILKKEDEIENKEEK